MWRPRRRHSTNAPENDNAVVSSSLRHRFGFGLHGGQAGGQADGQSSSLRNLPDQQSNSKSKSKSKNNTPTNRRSLRHRRWKRQQYHLVADEIESVLYDQGGDEHEHEQDTTRRTPPHALSLASSLSSTPRIPRLRRMTLQSLRRSSLSSIGTHATTRNLQPETAASNHHNDHTTTTTTTTRRRQRSSTTTTERDINSYTLFDAAGEEDSGSLGRNSNNNYSYRNNNIVIYAKNYSPGAFFTSILLFLSVTFVLLVVIRILVSLLTMAVGMVVLVLLGVRVLQEFMFRPLGLFRTLHASPVCAWAFLGGLGGVGGVMGHAVCYYSTLFLMHLQMQLIGTDTTDTTITTATAITAKAITTKHDVLLLWGFLEGLVYGVEIGALWWVVLGDASDPSMVANWIHRHLWRRLQAHYQTSMRQRRQARILASELQRRKSTNNNNILPTSNATATNDDDIRMSDARPECMICLETFGSNESHDDDDENNNCQRRQQLPCLHGFHANCLQQWLAIKQTCPICRIPVIGPSSEEQQHQGPSQNDDDSRLGDILAFD
jgi:uncharacterized membrane protein